jgi:hypothetical protein
MASYSNRFQANADRIAGLVGNNGGAFASKTEVREYFTTEQLTDLFPGEEIPDQGELDDLADLVIEYRLTDASNMWDRAWVAAHTCPECGEHCPESMVNEESPSWECATCLATENDED